MCYIYRANELEQLTKKEKSACKQLEKFNLEIIFKQVQKKQNVRSRLILFCNLTVLCETLIIRTNYVPDTCRIFESTDNVHVVTLALNAGSSIIEGL